VPVVRSQKLGLRTVHPFPARMAAEIAFGKLNGQKKSLRILDPMVGSGTTIAVAARKGHETLGFDTDPLAILITRVWCANVSKSSMILLGKVVLEQAKQKAKRLSSSHAFPYGCKDKESKAFIRYWFDTTNRVQLCALSRSIRRLRNKEKREVLWCAFSRMIIKKKNGVSLAMDVSHSRPHRIHDYSCHKVFDVFERTLENLLEAIEKSGRSKIKPVVKLGDARDLPIASQSVDMVITSPPYLNAIDYLRGHRLSLVWMGYSIPRLREIRSNNIGTQLGSWEPKDNMEKIMSEMCPKRALPRQLKGMLRTYVIDLDALLRETFRVLRPRGCATFVIGNSCVQGVYVKNSTAIKELGKAIGFKLKYSKIRRLPANRRYLPPPSKNAGVISNRMRTETVLTFTK
jgi:DNA modification methylase